MLKSKPVTEATFPLISKTFESCFIFTYKIKNATDDLALKMVFRCKFRHDIKCHPRLPKRNFNLICNDSTCFPKSV